MKNFKITVSGSGTKNQIEISLLTAVQELQFSEVETLCEASNICPFYEDQTICVEITEE